MDYPMLYFLSSIYQKLC